MKQLIKGFALLLTAAFTMGNSGNWSTTVKAGDRGYVIGNPEAEHRLIEFVSYTCPHCATFTIEGEAPLQYVYIGSGKLNLEVRSVIRNVVDLTATLLVQCGDTSRFLQNHTMFMTRQDVWLAKARSSSRSQQAIWMSPDALRGRQNMAQYLGFYDMMETRGYSRPELDRCLSDAARARELEINTSADFAEFGIRGTPSFALDGATLADVHSWQALRPHLDANF